MSELQNVAVQETQVQHFPHYLMQYFAFSHLPEAKQEASKPFAELAGLIDRQFPNNLEKTAALRKLLEAKDCAVRSTFFKSDR